MAKRSPILGYNHNVRYRGLIFHVQTEDSGVLSPHLFTHMFHGGVIVSTRKLVYDAGSAEDSIKSLMQAQHKAVLKDLKRGVFDDKIDEYLGNTEGLLPRGASEEREDRPSEPLITIEPGDLIGEPGEPISEPQITIVPGSEPSLAILAMDTTQPTPVIHELEEVVLSPTPTKRTPVPPPPIPKRPSETIAASASASIAVTKRPSEPVAVTKRPSEPIAAAKRPSEQQPAIPPPTPRTITSERKSAPTSVRSSLPPAPSSDLDPPTDLDPMGSVITLSPPSADDDFAEEASPRSEPDIEILRLEMEDVEEVAPPNRRRAHDTELSLNNASAPARSRPPESAHPLPSLTDKRTGERSAVGAASLPPVRPLARPALTTPTVMSRPVPQPIDPHRESDAIEVYAPAPAGVDPPPGAVERPGAYAQHNSRRGSLQELPPMRERKDSSQSSIPAGLGRPRATGAPGTGPIPRQIKPEPSPGTSAKPQTINPSATQPIRPISPSAPARTSSPGMPAMRGNGTTEPVRGRTPTPSRMTGPRTPNPSSGVVMTRPAVIVGAPPKASVPRVRKAREEEGRGFGQGLISEKSLDEVILAYLSEDADEK